MINRTKNLVLYLLVGPGRYSGPISNTLEILMTPPIVTSPVNSEGTIVFSALELVYRIDRGIRDTGR